VGDDSVVLPSDDTVLAAASFALHNAELHFAGPATDGGPVDDEARVLQALADRLGQLSRSPWCSEPVRRGLNDSRDRLCSHLVAAAAVADIGGIHPDLAHHLHEQGLAVVAADLEALGALAGTPPACAPADVGGGAAP
jgi:hypothetical protein